MPDIIQCRICQKPFQSFGGKVCHNCLTEVDEAFIKIRDFLEENPDKSSIEEISEGTDTPKVIVLELLKQQRLSVYNGIEGGLRCQYCHRPISNGVMCEKCRNELSQTLIKSLPKQPEKPKNDLKHNKPKMHIDFNRK